MLNTTIQSLPSLNKHVHNGYYLMHHIVHTYTFNMLILALAKMLRILN